MHSIVYAFYTCIWSLSSEKSYGNVLRYDKIIALAMRDRL